ncbi:hypothetical protein SCHPADRAFT_900823 [Schizopora paradoxa]|uniref:Uncharacterized protein n=1 Tax=Schizopora paradoxa TaxID=27342 RepID=A0A0H2RYM4_9AGAM|nr:hypothetical protein SCHPADRAFT_900823 [Schizopora paradoxa]
MKPEAKSTAGKCSGVAQCVLLSSIAPITSKICIVTKLDAVLETNNSKINARMRQFCARVVPRFTKVSQRNLDVRVGCDLRGRLQYIHRTREAFQ